jgi:glutathione S-transferase
MWSDTRLTLIGNHISPFVRKVLAVCRIKGFNPAIDAIVPFFGDDRFTALSPLRRVPVLLHGDAIINDSTVIAEYLEDLLPTPSILPGHALDRARSRFLDEFADTRMAQVMLWGVFGKAVVRPGIFGETRDLAAIARHMTDDVPGIMDILERHAPADGFIAGDAIGLGDLSVASQIINVRWARQSIEAERWPRASAWITRVEAHVALKPLNDIGSLMVRQPPAQYQEVLRAAGGHVAPDTFATATPRRAPASQA